MTKNTIIKTNNRRSFLKKAALSSIAALALSELPSEAQTATRITNIAGMADIFRLTVDGVQYIIVISNSGVAITKHR